ncbi:motile sperm domain-containing protein 1-like [Actinia tenebrosa]|uniref:Motile sperm domain-containing protein 3 n=1 Tax=Actinia tenebrosa TaxID=6105 RepID=A0A6P8HE36_ACTTE|nr:motile sperm domain-containing protein 1-like [Actinia tenebrosa]
MRSVQSSHFTDGSLPVFVFPNTLNFYVKDQSTHKQILTVYNPYEFVLRFKVLCTAPSRYLVVDAEGLIKPRCCVDIVIRHTAIHSTPINQQDKFRLQVFEHGVDKILGRKEIPSVILSSRVGTEKEKSTKPSDRSSRIENKAAVFQDAVPYHGTGYTPSFWVVLLAIACIAAVMLPLQGESASSRLPSYLHMSVNQKLVAAFILGLVTMALLKTN